MIRPRFYSTLQSLLVTLTCVLLVGNAVTNQMNVMGFTSNVPTRTLRQVISQSAKRRGASVSFSSSSSLLRDNIGTMSFGEQSKTMGGNVLTPLIVCGPSGVGKGTIISQYMEKYGGSQHFGFTVSHTTRKPRPGEIHGIHYHFTEYDTMQRDITNGKFLEHAQVHGNLYGTSYQSMETVQIHLRKICLLDIDVQGVKNIKERQELGGSRDGMPELMAKFVFVAPPSMDVLRERLVGRGTETEESLERRTRNAAAEMEYGMTPGNFDKIIVNGDIEQACRDFDAAVKELYNL